MESIGIDEAMRNRHSVRKYQDKPLEEHTVRELQKVIDTCNAEGHLKFQMVTGSKGAFEGLLARSFDGASNYVALVKKKDDPDEKVGYYGEWVVLHAQMLGMNTCWVGLTYSKRKLDIRVGKDEKLVCVLALGYGADQGVAHESKPMEELCDCDGDMPEWFRNGMEAAMLAPTAMNKQKFRFTLNGDGKVSAKTAGGPYTEVDLGIAKLHFELGAGKDNFQWA